MTEVETLPPLSFLFRGITGSTAYGLNHADSDIDRKAIFMFSDRDVYGLERPAETYTQHEPDIEAHEIGKYLRLTLQCNPNLLELLFLPPDCVEHYTFEWFELANNRDRFLSEKAVRDSYGGYAKQQIARMQRRDEAGYAKKAKHARHCFRLFWQGAQLLETGEMNVRLDAEQRRFLFELGEEPVEEIVKEFEAQDRIFQATPSRLPSEPDRDWVNDWLIDLRLSR